MINKLQPEEVRRAAHQAAAFNAAPRSVTLSASRPEDQALFRFAVGQRIRVTANDHGCVIDGQCVLIGNRHYVTYLVQIDSGPLMFCEERLKPAAPDEPLLTGGR